MFAKAIFVNSLRIGEMGTVIVDVNSIKNLRSHTLVYYARNPAGNPKRSPHNIHVKYLIAETREA